jgi:tetratricopeptide (TPR) repeat protein
MATRYLNVCEVTLSRGILMADTNFKFCTACGRKAALNAQFCGGCGAAFGAKEKSVQTPTQKASAAAPVKKETAPTQQGLTAKEWSDKGGALAQSGRDREALQCCDKALEIDPQYANAWALKGTVLDILKRPQEALPCFDKALTINPKDGGTWSMKGGVLYELGRRGEAIQCLDKALEINPKDADAWVKRGAVFYESGFRQEAIQCLNEALEINPQNARVQQFKRIINASK